MDTEALIAGWFDGDLDQREASALSAWLSADRAHALRFARMAQAHRALHVALRPDGAAGVVPGRTRSANGAHRERGRPSRPTLRVARRRRARPGRFPLAAALAAVAATIAVALIVAREPSPAPPSVAWLVAGRAVVADAAATAPVAIAAGVAIRADGAATIAYADGTTIALDAGSRLALDGDAVAKRIRLDAGAIGMDVPPQASALRIASPHGDAEILGTLFTLDVAAHRTRLDVVHGRVRLTAKGGASAVVGAGEWAEAGPVLATVVRRASDPARPPPPAADAPAISGFTLVDAATRAAIPAHGPIGDGAIMDLAALPTRALNIRADASPATTSVDFHLSRDGILVEHRREDFAPFCVMGDTPNGDVKAWTPAPGAYVLRATPIAGPRRGEAIELRFVVR
ncbi:MAG TPA: FecR family protein [Planctomycetota bacterium]|nr:FecR family protein [Planctomycetota bacterium]